MRKNPNIPETRKKLTREQILAIELGKINALDIARDYPSIANDYRSGYTQNKIAKKYCIVQKYGLTKKIANEAVRRALGLLIPKEELYRLEIDHRTESRKNVYAAGLGINSMTTKQRKEACSNGGKKSVENHVGCQSFTPYQRAEAGRKGGTMATLSKGLTPWSDEERIYLLDLCQTPEYQHSSGRHIGKPDYKKISVALKARFGTERTTGTLGFYTHHFMS